MTKISSEDALLDAALESPELAPFAMFEVDLGASRTPQGELLFPELKGKYTPWWNITSNGGSEVNRRKEERQIETNARQIRVENMVKRVANGLPPLKEDNTHQKDHDEWDIFWEGAAPTQMGYIP